MKISTPVGARTRALSLKVDDEKPKGWEEGDDIPQIRHSAEFDENGNADVSDACGEVMVSTYKAIKKGHNPVPKSTETEE